MNESSRRICKRCGANLSRYAIRRVCGHCHDGQGRLYDVRPARRTPEVPTATERARRRH